MLVTIRQSIARTVLVVGEVAGTLISLSGATAALVFGRVLLAVVLAAIAVGFFLRLTNRRASAASPPAPTPLWVFAASALLSAVEVAVLVEATKLPVRFDQPMFEKHNWLLVVLALLVAFVVQVQVFRALRPKSRVETQP